MSYESCGPTEAHISHKSEHEGTLISQHNQ